MVRSRLSLFAALGAAVLWLFLTPAFATTLYVAVTGTDTGTCGSSANPCRSISQAHAHAHYGDTIEVGPGRYGDLNANGVLGDSPGEEFGSPYCSCMIFINESVKLVSTGGAKATFLDARTLNVSSNVEIRAPNMIFGKPGKGFTVTGTNSGSNYDSTEVGVYVSAGAGITVSGNQVVALGANFNLNAYTVGIWVDSDASSVQIQGNQVIGWSYEGIIGAPQTTISDNAVALAILGDGIVSGGASVSGNITSGNDIGIRLHQGAAVTGNTTTGNGYGVIADDNSAVAQENNIEENICGVYAAAAGFNAEKNYWGAATGPGGPPADGVCAGSQSVQVTPYATTPFRVKVKLAP